MIKLQFADGTTVPLNLDDKLEAERLVKTLGRASLQDSIRGGVIQAGHTAKGRPFTVQSSVPRPDSFSNVWYEAELVENRGRPLGERIVVFADDVRLTVTSFHSQAATRIELAKIGRRRIRT